MAVLIISCAVSGCLAKINLKRKELLSQSPTRFLQTWSIWLESTDFLDYISEISDFDITINIVDSKVAMLEALRFEMSMLRTWTVVTRG